MKCSWQNVVPPVTQTVPHQRREKEQRDQAALQSTRDALQAKTEADRIFSEKQQLKAQRIREDERKLQDFNATQMVMSRLFQPQFWFGSSLLPFNFNFSFTGWKDCQGPAAEKRRTWVWGEEHRPCCWGGKPVSAVLTAGHPCGSGRSAKRVSTLQSCEGRNWRRAWSRFWWSQG